MKVYLVVYNYNGVATPIAITLDEKLAEKYAGDRFYVVPVDFNEGVFCHFGEDDCRIDLNYLDAEGV
jgi:hypothetical protein